VKKAIYTAALRALQIELVKFQRQLISAEEKILIVLEGRDAAGKDGTIKRIVEHMSPRETRVVALGKPSDAENHSWYFQRFVPHLPMPAEFVLFNRSWYNRAGVERVMGFCSNAQYQEFMDTVIDFERMLVRSGVQMFKYYLDISRREQRERLQERREDPLTQWKISPIDRVAQEKWDDYSVARDEMLRRTDHEVAPWTIVKTDKKKDARIAVISDLLDRLDYKDKDPKVIHPDRKVIFRFSDGRMSADGPAS